MGIINSHAHKHTGRVGFRVAAAVIAGKIYTATAVPRRVKMMGRVSSRGRLEFLAAHGWVPFEIKYINKIHK